MLKKNTIATQDLGTRLKSYESDFETIISNEQHIVVRIDGHKFSTFTKSFKKPFDTILANTMVQTTEALVEEFKVSTGYTQSDEITLIIPSYKNIIVDNRRTKSEKKRNSIEEKESKEWTHNLGGRVQKLVSLIAGFTTKEFNKLLLKNIELVYQEPNNTPTDYAYLDVIRNKVFEAYFDARTYGVDTADECFNSVLWRVRDAEKNSVSNAAYVYLPHKKLLQLNGQERKEMLLKEKGINWEEYDSMFKYGTLVKKQRYTKIMEDGSECIRTRIITFSEKLNYSPENVYLIMAKFLEENSK